jgi:hypothetical protein
MVLVMALSGLWLARILFAVLFGAEIAAPSFALAPAAAFFGHASLSLLHSVARNLRALWVE